MSTGPTEPLPKKCADWLVKVVGIDGASGVVAEKEKHDAQEQRRDGRLAKVREEIDRSKGEIQQQMNIQVMVKGKNMLGMSSQREVSSTGKGGPDAQLDPTLDMPSVDSIPNDARIRAQQAGEKVIKLSLKAQGYIHRSDWKAVVEATKTKSLAEVATEWGVSEKTITMVVERDKTATADAHRETGTSERLVDESVGDPDEVLDDVELRQEFWKPLVREGVYPENFVTDRYDETTQIFQGAAAEYDARIDEINETFNEAEARKESMAAKTEFIKECAETAKAIAEAAGISDGAGDHIEIVAALADAGVAMYDNWNEKDAEKAIPSVAKAIEALVTKMFDKATGKAVSGCFQAIAKGGAFRSHLLSDEPDGTEQAFKSLGDAAAAAFGVSEATAKVGSVLKTALYAKGKAKAAYTEVQKLRQNQATIADVLKAVKEAAVEACSAAAKDLITEDQAEAIKVGAQLTESAGKNLASKKLLAASKDVGNMLLTLGGDAVPGVGECFVVLKTALKVDKFAQLLREGNTEEADKLLDEAIKAVEGKVKDLKKEAEAKEKEAEKKPESEGDAEPPKDQAEGGDKPAEEEAGGEDGDGDDDGNGDGDGGGDEGEDSTAFGIAAQIKNRLVDLTSTQKAMEEKTEEVDAQQQEDEDAEFSAQLALAFGESDGDPEMLEIQKEVHSLDRLIKQVQKDQGLLKMADKVFSAGVKTAAQFYAAIETAGVAKSLVKDMVAAGRRYQELTRWTELHKVALEAASAQGYSFANRVTNLRIEVGRKTLDALLELGQLVGTAAGAVVGGATAGPGGAAVGMAASAKAGTAAAKATQGIVDLCMKLYSASELRNQWKLYQEAKTPPPDRRKMRAALRDNSTLAKYAMAYAAVEEGDAVASEGMRLCGLSEETLKHPGTDVAKVVRFLELKFEQDPQVLKASNAQAWQADKSNGLTLESWVKNRAAAQKQKVLDESVATALIEDNLSQVQAAQDDLAEVEEDCEPAKQAYDSQAASYLPLLDIYTTEAKRCAALDAFLTPRTAESEKLKTDIGSAANVTAPQRKDFEKQLNTLDRHLTDCTATLATAKAAAIAYEKVIEPYVSTIDPYATAITKYETAFTKCATALATLTGALKAFKPKKKQAEQLVESPEMAAYAQALVKSAAITDAGHKTKQSELAEITKTLGETKSAAADNQSALAATKSSIDELSRKVEALNRDITATRDKLTHLPTV